MLKHAGPRHQTPVRGVLAPGACLHAAEASGMLEAIDWQMFQHCCQLVASILQGEQDVN